MSWLCRCRKQSSLAQKTIKPSVLPGLNREAEDNNSLNMKGWKIPRNYTSIIASTQKSSQKASGEQDKKIPKNQTNLVASNQKPSQNALSEQDKKAKPDDGVADELHKAVDEVAAELHNAAVSNLVRAFLSRLVKFDSQQAQNVWEASTKKELLVEIKQLLEDIRIASESYAKGET